MREGAFLLQMRVEGTIDAGAKEVLERLCGRDLSAEEVAEAVFNLVTFSRTLFEIYRDCQHEKRIPKPVLG